MNKQLKFTYQDKDYCLEFTRKSVETMEKNGFVATGETCLIKGTEKTDMRYELTL